MNRVRSIAVGSGGPDTVRFSWLLAALLAVLALPPLLHTLHLAGVSLRVGLAAVLVASLVAVSRRRSSLRLGLALAIPAIALDWASLALGTRSLAIASGLLTVAFLALVVWSMGEALLRAQRVTADTILGGICIYLLLGILWVAAFTLLEIAEPGSLLLNGAPLQDAGDHREVFRYTEILYFSFVTLTTIGYGDVLPTSTGARALASGEGIVGQLYVAIFVARLVGLHLVQTRGSSDE